MRITFNIKKQHFYILIILILFLGFGFVFAGEWRDAGRPQSHDTLWTKEIVGKEVSIITVSDDLNVNGRLCINGVCISSWNEIIPATSTLWYKDEDGDNYAGPITMLSPTRPTPQNQWKTEFELTSRPGLPGGLGDCYDKNANARPGQVLYFNVQRGDGTFDYNCDSSVTYKLNEMMDGQCYNGIREGRIGDTEYYCEGSFAGISIKKQNFGNLPASCYAQESCSGSSYAPATTSAYRR